MSDKTRTGTENGSRMIYDVGCYELPKKKAQTQAAAHQAPARDTAKEFILDYLKDGAKETSDLDEAMKAMGISIGTLKRAKADLKTDGKLEYFNEGFGPSKKYYCKLSGTE